MRARIIFVSRGVTLENSRNQWRISVASPSTSGGMGVKNRRTSRVRFDLTKRLGVSGVKRIGNTPSGPRNPPSGPANESGGMNLGLAAFIGGCPKGSMRPTGEAGGTSSPARDSRAALAQVPEPGPSLGSSYVGRVAWPESAGFETIVIPKARGLARWNR